MRICLPILFVIAEKEYHAMHSTINVSVSWDTRELIIAMGILVEIDSDFCFSVD